MPSATGTSILSEVFGFDAFRPGQAEIVSRPWPQARDVLAIHAHRGREIPVLPAARPDAPRRDRGDLAVDCA